MIHEGQAMQGRWPANVILSGDAAELLDAQSGQLTSGGGVKRRGGTSVSASGWKDVNRSIPPKVESDTGGASRFFFNAPDDDPEDLTDVEYQEATGSMILHGDCREVMAAMEPNSVDAIVTDPPYGLTANKNGGSGVASIDLDSPYGRARIGTGNGSGGFMGKKWDGTGIERDPTLWAEALRVLKPGGHMLAFGGTRTFHRIAVAIEDAGFEIRDTLVWIHAQGFPKGTDFAADHEETRRQGRRIPKPEFVGTPFEQGWNCALKPGHEPIILARKPLDGTVAGNVLTHGVGALNIDACRIEHTPGNEGTWGAKSKTPGTSKYGGDVYFASKTETNTERHPAGRWPANVVLDEESARHLDAMSGERKTGARSGKQGRGVNGIYSDYAGFDGPSYDASTGGASRFFLTVPIDDPDAGHQRFMYCAKASRAERSAGLDTPSNHPTVKPLSLMKWLCKLITPPARNHAVTSVLLRATRPPQPR